MSETRKELDWSKPLQRVDGEPMKFKEIQSDDHYPILCVDSAGSEWCFTGSGRVYFPDHGIETSLDLINVPEPTEQPSIGDSVSDHGRRLDEFWRRCDKIEERLANIERLATCGTGPNEPEKSFPAQAAVGEAVVLINEATGIGNATGTNFPLHGNPEASAVEQPPFRVGQVVECVDVGPYCHMLKVGERYKVTRIYPQFNDWLIDTETDAGFYATRFRALPPTAERESGPTPGMEAAIQRAANRIATKIVPSGHNRVVASSIIHEELGPELAALRAEMDEARADCIRVEDAARSLGPEGCDPIFCIDAAKKQLATAREAAEAMMEALRLLPNGRCGSKTGRADYSAMVDGDVLLACTKTLERAAAILAAKNAASTTKGGE